MKVRIGRTLSGRAGAAQEQFVQLEPGDNPDFQAHLGSWFILAPLQSPAWDHYILSLIHLRPIEGVEPAVILQKGATHEFQMAAIAREGIPVADNPATWRWLQPVNLSEQVNLPSDEAAVRLLERCVREIVEGRLWAEPPLAGQVEPWRSVLRATAEHAWGRHGEMAS